MSSVAERPYAVCLVSMIKVTDHPCSNQQSADAKMAATALLRIALYAQCLNTYPTRGGVLSRDRCQMTRAENRNSSEIERCFLKMLNFLKADSIKVSDTKGNYRLQTKQFPLNNTERCLSVVGGTTIILEPFDQTNRKSYKYGILAKLAGMWSDSKG